MTGEGSTSFAQQTVADSSRKRSFASLKMTSVGHSEQREESHKLDCFTNNPTTAMRALYKGGSVRNDVKTLVPQYLSALVPSKRIAFTLAEVLVTLGIIGVISAMTLPTLVKNHQRQVFVTQLRKVVTEVTQAVETAINDHNAVSFREAHITEANFLQNYFKTVKTCTDSEEGLKDCFADEYKNLNGHTIRLRDIANGSCAVIASGASMCVSYWGQFMNVNVDVNGKQGPNIYGRDLFKFLIDEDGNIKSADSWGLEEDLQSTCSSATDNYAACFTRILNNGWVMDY